MSSSYAPLRVRDAGNGLPRAAAASSTAPVRRVLVIGAGISGLTAALMLARRGISVEIWEASEAPGGLLRPVEFRGVQCDLGSHRLHPEAFPVVGELTSDLHWLERPRRGRLVLRGRQLGYPIQLTSFLRG